MSKRKKDACACGEKDDGDLDECENCEDFICVECKEYCPGCESADLCQHCIGCGHCIEVYHNMNKIMKQRKKNREPEKKTNIPKTSVKKFKK
jgi:hypothetical protein